MSDCIRTCPLCSTLKGQVYVTRYTTNDVLFCIMLFPYSLCLFMWESMLGVLRACVHFAAKVFPGPSAARHRLNMVGEMGGHIKYAGSLLVNRAFFY